MMGKTHQQDLDGSQDVHGSGEGGAQVEAKAHRPPKLWTQRATDHKVGASRWRRRRRRGSGAGCTKEGDVEEGESREEEEKRWDINRERDGC